MAFGVDGEKKFLQLFIVSKNGAALGEIAKWEILSYSKKQEQNEIMVETRSLCTPLLCEVNLFKKFP